MSKSKDKTRYVRVDSDIVDRIIQKEDAPKNNLSADETDKLSEAFSSQIPSLDKANFTVDVQSLGASFQPVLVTQNEYNASYERDESVPARNGLLCSVA